MADISIKVGPELTDFSCSNVRRWSVPKQGGGTATFLEPSGSLSITQNGSYDVSEYAGATVNISGAATVKAFARCICPEGSTATATDGTTTLQTQCSDSVLSLPTVGSWTFTSGGRTETRSLSFGDSITVDLRTIEIKQVNTGRDNTDISWSADSSSVSFHWLALDNSSGWGVIVKMPEGKGARVSISSSGDKQMGCCVETATLPTVISSGAGRRNYSTGGGPNIISYNANAPCFFAGVYNTTPGTDVTITFEMVG